MYILKGTEVHLTLFTQKWQIDWYVKCWDFLMDKVATFTASSGLQFGFSNLLDKWYPFLEYAASDPLAEEFSHKQHFYDVMSYL